MVYFLHQPNSKNLKWALCFMMTGIYAKLFQWYVNYVIEVYKRKRVRILQIRHEASLKEQPDREEWALLQEYARLAQLR